MGHTPTQTHTHTLMLRFMQANTHSGFHTCTYSQHTHTLLNIICTRTHTQGHKLRRVIRFHQLSLSQTFKYLKWFSFGRHVSSHLRVVLLSLFSTVYSKHARLLLKTTSDKKMKRNEKERKNSCLPKFLQLGKYTKTNKTCMQVFQGPSSFLK